MAAQGIHYRYDNSFEGMLCAVAAAVKQDEPPVQTIYARGQFPAPLWGVEVDIPTDSDQAQRLFAYLKNLGHPAPRLAINGYLSEDRHAPLHLFYLVRCVLSAGATILHQRNHDAVRYLERLCYKVDREAHRFYGLLRFSLLEDDLLYAPYASVCNIISYQARHFSKRLAGRRWIIHDLQRNIALLWDTALIRPVRINPAFTNRVKTSGLVPESALNGSEQQVRKLWRSFHRIIANDERTNLSLQRQHMPKQYWKYLIEMQER